MARGIKEANIKIKKDKTSFNDDLFIHKTIFDTSKEFEYKSKVIMCYENKRIIRKLMDVPQYPMDSFMILTVNGFEKAMELSAIGRKLLTYIIKHLKINSNYVILDTNKIKFELAIPNDQMVSRAKKELVDNEFIGRAPDEKVGVYVINHNMFFRGSRNEFIDKYKKEFLIDDCSDIPMEVGEQYFDEEKGYWVEK